MSASARVRRMISPSAMPASTAREDSGIQEMCVRCCSVSREDATTTPPSMVSSTRCVSRLSPSSALGVTSEEIDSARKWACRTESGFMGQGRSVRVTSDE